jgi:hypothetical protein
MFDRECSALARRLVLLLLVIGLAAAAVIPLLRDRGAAQTQLRDRS